MTDEHEPGQVTITKLIEQLVALKHRHGDLVVCAGGARAMWLVIVGTGDAQRCYGLFESNDAAIAWLKANQLPPIDYVVLPVVSVT